MFYLPSCSYFNYISEYARTDRIAMFQVPGWNVILKFHSASSTDGNQSEMKHECNVFETVGITFIASAINFARENHSQCALLSRFPRQTLPGWQVCYNLASRRWLAISVGFVFVPESLESTGSFDAPKSHCYW